MDMLSPEMAEQIFNECDSRRQGALTLADFCSLSQFTDADTCFIFEQLDVNKDGLVNKEEFVDGFARALNLGEMSGYSGIKRRASSYTVLPHERTTSTSSMRNNSIEEIDCDGTTTTTTTSNIVYDFDNDSSKLDVLPW